MITYSFTDEELELVEEALKYRASRHESEARFNPRNKQPHTQTAVAMRKLAKKLTVYSMVAVLALTVFTLKPASAGQRCWQQGNTWVCCNSGGWGCQ